MSCGSMTDLSAGCNGCVLSEAVKVEKSYGKTDLIDRERGSVNVSIHLSCLPTWVSRTASVGAQRLREKLSTLPADTHYS